MTTNGVTPVVILYRRVSTDEQRRKGYSLPEQLQLCRAKAKELAPDAEVLEFVDNVSGSITDGREQLDLARERCRRGRADYFVCLHPDRFARDLFGQMTVYDELRRGGVKVVFVQVGFEDSPEGRLFFQMVGAISEYERAKIRERSMRGKRGKMKAGGIPIRVEPYGFEWDSETDKPIPKLEELRWVHQMFTWAAGAGGKRMGCQQIANHLDQLGVPTKKGGRWARATVRLILRNPVYIGRVELNKLNTEGLQVWRRVPMHRRPKVKGANGEEKPLTITPKRRPRDQWFAVQIKTDENQHVFIGEALWSQVQSIMDGARRTGRPTRYLLTGVMTCGLCGGRARMFPGRHRLYIRCERRYPREAGYRDWDSQDRCMLPHIHGEPVVNGVWGEVHSWIMDPNQLRLKLEAGAASNRDDANRGRQLAEAALLRQEAEARREAQAQVLRMMQKRVLDPSVAEKELGKLQRELEHLEGKFGQLDAEQGSEDHGATERAVKSLEALRDQLAPIMQDLDLDDELRRQTLLRLVKQVIIRPDGTWEVIPHA